ncbi:MAG: hypothetical protein ACR2P7_00640 [bacterium]
MFRFILSTPRILLALFLLSGALSANANANEKFSIDGGILHYNTDLPKNENDQEITEDDVDYFKKVLKENPDIKTVHITSSGGITWAAIEIADLIIDYDLNTHVTGVCFSACPLLFLGGTKRTLERGSKIGFHRSWWPVDDLKEYYESEKEYYEWESVYDFASWVHDDAQEDMYNHFKFLLERGIEPSFVIETVSARSDEDGWYPRRKQLLNAGFLTE